MTKNEMTFKEKMKQLDELLAWFESDEVNLDEAVEKYEEALKLSKEIEQDLAAAKNKVEILQKKFSA